MYQKDGPGRLIRIYLDKFKAPEIMVEEFQKIQNTKQMLILKCQHCDQKIGHPMIYKPENRLAYNLIQGSFSKKVSKDGYFSSLNK